MAKRKITKKDPKKELSGWIDYKNKTNTNEKRRVSASLTKLQAERRHALLTRLGFIIFFSLCCILALGYYISPKANVASVQVKGAPLVIAENDLNPNNFVSSIDHILLDTNYAKKMSEASKKLGVPDASDQVISVMESLIKNK